MSRDPFGISKVETLSWKDLEKKCPLCEQVYLFAQDLADHLRYTHHVTEKKLKELMNKVMRR
jgi:phage FluMu protein Com